MLRTAVYGFLGAALFSLLTGAALGADHTSLLFVFGPAAEQAGKQAAQASAGTARRWLDSGSTVEIQIHGIADTQAVNKGMKDEALEKAFLDAAKDGHGSDVRGFLNDLDRAAFSLRRHTGKRLLLAVLDGTQINDQAQGNLQSTTEFCKSNSIQIIVLDTSGALKDANPMVAALATVTSGALLRDDKELATNALVLPEKKTGDDAPAAGITAAASTPGLTVHTRLIRTLPNRLRKPGAGIGPMSGLLLAEAPMRHLEFEKNERAGTYLARVQVTQVVRNEAGDPAWQAKKEITLKGPLSKLALRLEGNLCYMRELKLPAGQYTVEAKIEDLLGKKSVTASEPLQAGDSLPGFAVSDALFVRYLNDALDKFEGDQVLSFDGKALAPLLAPVFRANVANDIKLYFIIYPDLSGSKPDINFEIMHKGQAVGRSHLAFQDELRNTTTEGGALDARGEQKHEFPFVATILGASFDAGDYEARVTVRQDSRIVTRTVPFRVTNAVP